MAEVSTLYIYRDDSEGNATLFPNSTLPAKLYTYEYNATRMGSAPTIEAEVMYPTCLDEEWRNKDYGKPYVTFNGEKYYVMQVPTSSKSYSDQRYKHEVTFESARVVIENIYAYDVVSTLSKVTARDDIYRSNTTSFSFYGDIEEFVARINDSLVYSGVCTVATTTDDDGNVVADLDDDGNIQLEGYHLVIDDGVTTDSLEVSFEDLKVSEALQEIYNVYELTYYWVGTICHVGSQEHIIEDALEYGSGMALRTVEKENAGTALCDIVTGYGGTTNLQYYYPNESSTGTALFTTTNIETTDVSTVDLSTIIKYSSDYLKTWIYGVRENTETSFEVFDYLYPYNDNSSYLSVSGKTVTITTTTKYGTSSGTTKYSWIYRMAFDGTAYAQLSIGSVSIDTDGSNWSGNLMWNKKSATSDTDDAQGWVIVTGKMVDQTDLSETDIDPDTPFTFLDDSTYYLELTFNFYYKSWSEDVEDASSTEYADWTFAIEGSVTYTTPTADSQLFLYGSATDDVSEYEEIAYSSSGIELLNASSAPSISTSWSLKTATATGTDSNGNEQTLVTVTLGSETTGDASSAATITITGREWMTVCSKLMPSIYRQTLGADRFYPADNTPTTTDDEGNEIADERYIIPDTDEYYEFENEYEAGDPHEAITEDDSIYPTIKNVYNAKGYPIAEIVDIAYDEDDSDALTDSSDEENPEYIHSYFYIKLHIFDGDMGFNLFTHALYSEEAYLTLTSGNCSACTFEIAVEKEENDEGTGYNFYNPVLTDGNGKLLKQTHYEPGDYVDDDDRYFGTYILPKAYKTEYSDEQQDTSANEVWIAVKKDNDTFGIVMPNVLNSYYPSIGDTFVLTGVGLPQTYIDAAERTLDEYLIQYMWENNTETFNYSITFSRLWIERNPDIAAQISENTLLNIKYNGIEHALFVSSYTCKASDDILYEITVELTDELTLGAATLKTQIDGVTSSVTNILASIKALQSSSSTTATALSSSLLSSLKARFLSKTDADSAAGLITLLKGLALGTGDYYITEEGVALLNSISAALLAISGDASVDGDLSVAGDASVDGDLSVGDDITVEGDIISTNFDEAAQKGFVLSRSADTGSYTLEISNIEVWGKATFNELEVRKVSAIGGSLILSPAASKIIVVDAFMYSERLSLEGGDIGDEVDYQIGWKCFYLADDGTTATSNTWVKGDQARCQSFNQIDSAGTYDDAANKDYWRLVIAVSSENEAIYDADGNELYDGELFGWVALSLEECQDGDLTTLDETDDDYSESLYKASVPASGDAIVCLGHQTQISYTYDDDGNITGTEKDDYTNRMHAVVHTAATDEGPTVVFYKNINSFSLEGCIVEYHCPGGQSYVYSTYFKTLTDSGKEITSYKYEGTWVSGTTVYYGQYFTYNGDLWLWTGDDGVTPDDPSEDVDGWVRMTYTSVGSVIEIKQSLGGFIYPDEEETVTLSVWDYSGNDKTDEYTFTVKRDSGDESDDAVWNAESDHLDCGTEFTIGYDDLNITARIAAGSVTTTFYIYATAADGTVETSALTY